VPTGGNALTYTATAPTTNTYYRARITCANSGLSDSSLPYFLQVVSPQVSSFVGGARCGPGSVILSATPTAGDSIRWYASTTATTPLALGNTFTTPSLTGTTTYYVQAYRGACQSTRTAVVATINPFPNVTVTASGSLFFCPGQSVTLTVPSATNKTYVWSNNGTPITGATANSYVANTAGNFSVLVTDTITGCFASSLPVTTTLSAPPATINPANAVEVCPGANATFTTPSAPGLTYQWRRNGTIIAGATSASYTSNVLGSYTVTVSNGASCSNTTPNPTVLTNYTPPTAAITASQGTQVCAGSTIPLSANLGNNLTYQWLVNNAALSGQTGVTYNASSAGSYTLRVVSTTTGCTTVSAPVVVTVNPLPTATASITGQAARCDSVNLTANTATGVNYQWMLGGVDVPGATTQTYSALTSGAYTVRVTNATTGCSRTSTPALNATVYPTPNATVTYNAPLNFCEGSGIVLTAPATSVQSSYVWYQNGTPTGDTTEYIIATEPGNYTLMVTNMFGCSRTSVTPVTITVDPAPQPTITRNGNVLSTGSFATYQWMLNNVAIPGATSQTHTATAAGSYRVQVTNLEGCFGQSGTIYLSTTSVGGVAGREAVRIFPNPASDRVFIETDEAVNVRLRDVSGRVVYEAAGVKEVPVGNLAAGLYHLIISDKKGALITTEKIVKIK
jgi:hypothetical protein